MQVRIEDVSPVEKKLFVEVPWDTVSTRLGEACAQCPPDVPMGTFLAQGDAGTAITRFAAEHASDAVVLARRSRLEPGRAAVLRAVLDQTPCPVLLVGD